MEVLQKRMQQLESMLVNTLKVFRTHLDALHLHVYSGFADFILSPSNFQASEHTLMFYTPSKSKHYTAINNLFEKIYNEGIEYDQFNVSFRNGLYKMRISFYNENDKNTIKNLLGFDDFKTLEQIRREVPDTLNVALV